MQELQLLLRAKEEQIGYLQKQLDIKDDVITELRSQLDKYKSVIPALQNGPRKHRAQGISAEPRSQHILKEMVNSDSRKHSKTPGYVITLVVSKMKNAKVLDQMGLPLTPLSGKGSILGQMMCIVSACIRIY